MQDAPPPVILAHTRVVAYAFVDDAVEFTGKLHLWVDHCRLGRVPRLAICRHFDKPEWLLLHCDETWQVLGIQGWNASDVEQPSSLEDVQQRAERYYRGVSNHWMTHPASDEEAREYFNGMEWAGACSFCGKGPSEVTGYIESPTARICKACVMEFYEEWINEDKNGPAEEG